MKTPEKYEGGETQTSFGNNRDHPSRDCASQIHNNTCVSLIGFQQTEHICIGLVGVGGRFGEGQTRLQSYTEIHLDEPSQFAF